MKAETRIKNLILLVGLASCAYQAVRGCETEKSNAISKKETLESKIEKDKAGKSYWTFGAPDYDPKCFAYTRGSIDKIVEKTRRCWGDIIEKTEKKYGIEEGVLAGLLIRESLGYPLMLNKANDGGAGLMMFQPGTARAYGLKVYENSKSTGRNKAHGRRLRELTNKYKGNHSALSKIDERFDPEKCIDAAGRFLRDLHKRYKTWDRALSAYNQGRPARNPLKTRHVRMSRKYQKMYLMEGNGLYRLVQEDAEKDIYMYEVRRGDTLYSIASRFNRWDNGRGNKYLEVRHTQILNAKMKKAGAAIRPGQRLRIVAKKKAQY
ncbi:MAG: hypothetical protein DRP29_06210 [Thermodesulfobacteriota bacterium]|nr:MAG: hypothetical protein DRP29_06210 [Thermodesulfobacteriota bacterium]